MSWKFQLIHVAVGIIKNAKNEVLIAQRPAHAYGGGLWEFPGGKVEKNESVFAALQREFTEEIGIQVVAADAWLQIQHDYGDRIVLLDVWWVREFLGEPIGAEGQKICWTSLEQLTQFQFPAANEKIIQKLTM